jgi:hypothetical protein
MNSYFPFRGLIGLPANWLLSVFQNSLELPLSILLNQVCIQSGPHSEVYVAPHLLPSLLEVSDDAALAFDLLKKGHSFLDSLFLLLELLLILYLLDFPNLFNLLLEFLLALHHFLLMQVL